MTDEQNISENNEKSNEVLSPVVTGKTTIKKKSEGKKFIETFFKGDASQVRDSIWLDVIAPAIRDMIWGALERAGKGIIYGDFSSDRRRDERGSIPATRVDFTRYSKDRRRDEYRDRVSNDLYEYGEVFVESRRDAEAILDRLYELFDRYQWASVAQLYELANLRAKYTDHNYGWRESDRNRITIAPTRGGYLIKMPAPRPFD